MSSTLTALTSAPNTSATTTQSSTQLPSWYTDYTQQILNSAAQWAAQPYQTYQGPRIAQQSGLTQDAYGEAAPLSQSATDNTQAATNLVNASASQANSPLQTASPYISAGTNPTYNTVGNYMNPYMSNVLGGIANAGNLNFEQNALPQMQSSIIGAGNITGSNTEGTNLIENAEQQNEQNISNAQSQALQGGYSTALGAAQQGAANNLTAANTSGTLAQSGVSNLLNAGTSLSNVGTQGNANNIAAINAQNTLGQQDQGYNQSNLNLAYQDFLNQQQYPLTQASAMQNALSGIQVPTATTGYNYSSGTTSTSPLQTLTQLLG
jgi:hypothetical protein